MGTASAMASANIYGSNYDGQAGCKRISANFLLSEKPQKGKPQKALHTVKAKVNPFPIMQIVERCWQRGVPSPGNWEVKSKLTIT